jgi:hypothetical protein
MYTRASYDPKYYQVKVHESTGPLMYNMDPYQQAQCGECEMGFGAVASRPFYSASIMHRENIGNLVDAESVLRRQSSKDMHGDGKDHYWKKPRNGNKPAQGLGIRQCRKFVPEDSRLTHPIQNYRELGTDYQRIFQREIVATDYLTERIGINTKLMAKDNYKMKLPKPLNWVPSPSLALKAKPTK